MLSMYRCARVLKCAGVTRKHHLIHHLFDSAVIFNNSTMLETGFTAHTQLLPQHNTHDSLLPGCHAYPSQSTDSLTLFTASRELLTLRFVVYWLHTAYYPWLDRDLSLATLSDPKIHLSFKMNHVLTLRPTS